MHVVEELYCGGCGSALEDLNATRCKYCRKAIVVRNVSQLDSATPQMLQELMRQYERGDVAGTASQSGGPAELPTGSVEFSIGVCLLKLKLYAKAQQKFEAAIEKELYNPEVYLYAAVSLLGGKKAFLAPMPVIRKALEYVDAARMIENKGIYSLFAGYLKYDFFARKFLRISPDYREEIQDALSCGLTQEEFDRLFSLLHVSCPEDLLS